MNLITQNIEQVLALCKKYKVKSMYVFGSILTPRFNDKSDVDLLVNFSSDIDYLSYADNILDLYSELKTLLGRNIDLVDESAIKNPYFKKEVERTKQLIYGWKHKERSKAFVKNVKFLHVKTWHFCISLK